MSTVMSVFADSNAYILENGSARKSMTTGETWHLAGAAGPFDETAFSNAYGVMVYVISGSLNYRVDGSAAGGSSGIPAVKDTAVIVRSEEYDRLRIYATADAVLECSLIRK